MVNLIGLCTIISFIFHDIDQLTANKIEKTEELQNKLKFFTLKAEQKHCKYWKNSEDLGGKVSRSMIQLKKKHPSDGWIPGRFAADEKMFRKIEELRARIQELESIRAMEVNEPPIHAEGLAQGDETCSQDANLRNARGLTKLVSLKASWDKIFKYVGSGMIGECSEKAFLENVRLAYYHSIPTEFQKYKSYDNIVIFTVIFAKIKMQLQALGLITHGTKKRAVSDNEVYWKLTPYGEHYLIKISAVKSKKDNNKKDV